MSRYVDIELYEDCKIVLHKEDNGFKCSELPTADVREVRHGKWLYNSIADPVYRICELCGSVYAMQEGECKYCFCPNCGAIMDGE